MLESMFSEDGKVQCAGLMDRLRQRLSRQDVCLRAEYYLRGLLSQVDRKNSW